MGDRINVLDIDIDNFTAKEAMQFFVSYLESEPVSVIELVTADSLLRMEEVPGLREAAAGFDLVLAGDATVLESADVTEKRCLQEARERVFVRMMMRYLGRNHRRVYLLVESEKEGRELLDYMEKKKCGVQIAGMAKVSAQDRADDMIVNAINGADTECIISVLSSPLQEDLIVKTRSLLNANVWLGLGKDSFPPLGNIGVQGKFAQFLIKKIFQKELEKKKKSESDS